MEIWSKWYMDHCRTNNKADPADQNSSRGYWELNQAKLQIFFLKKNLQNSHKFFFKKKLNETPERFKKFSIKSRNFLNNFQDLSNEISIVIFNYLKIIVYN